MGSIRTRWAAIGAAVAVSLGAGGLFVAEASGSSASVFVPVVSVRVLDSRPDAEIGLKGPFVSDTARKLHLTGVIPTADGKRQVIPPGATAAVYNVTVVDPTAGGFVTVRAGDASGRPSTSTINFEAGDVAANGGTVALPLTGAMAGAIDIRYQGAPTGATTHVVMDIVGYYAAGSGAQGPAGPQGPKGAQGPAGPAGPEGPQGVGDLGCSTDQTISWDDAEEAWMCATPVTDTDTLAALECSVNQTIGWNGDAWECRSAPITASLTRNAFSPGCCDITDVFSAYTPNVDSAFGFCDDMLCQVHLVDVVDHTSCQVNVSSPNVEVFLLSDRIDLWDLSQADTETVYVNISCAPGGAPTPV